MSKIISRALVVTTAHKIRIKNRLNKVKALLKEEKDLSPAIRSMIELLALVMTLLVGSLNLNSSSSKPPSSDPNRKKICKAKGGKKAGGQKGRVGVTLQRVDDLVEIEVKQKEAIQ